jgi:hypothetical protein
MLFPLMLAPRTFISLLLSKIPILLFIFKTEIPLNPEEGRAIPPHPPAYFYAPMAAN